MNTDAKKNVIYFSGLAYPSVLLDRDDLENLADSLRCSLLWTSIKEAFITSRFSNLGPEGIIVIKSR